MKKLTPLSSTSDSSACFPYIFLFCFFQEKFANPQFYAKEPYCNYIKNFSASVFPLLSLHSSYFKAWIEKELKESLYFRQFIIVFIVPLILANL
jgi:hypothetical protein